MHLFVIHLYLVTKEEIQGPTINNLISFSDWNNFVFKRWWEKLLMTTPFFEQSVKTWCMILWQRCYCLQMAAPKPNWMLWDSYILITTNSIQAWEIVPSYSDMWYDPNGLIPLYVFQAKHDAQVVGHFGFNKSQGYKWH